MYTDHHNLEYIQQVKVVKPTARKLGDFFTSFWFTITYRPSPKNVKADARSCYYQLGKVSWAYLSPVLGHSGITATLDTVKNKCSFQVYAVIFHQRFQKAPNSYLPANENTYWNLTNHGPTFKWTLSRICPHRKGTPKLFCCFVKKFCFSTCFTATIFQRRFCLISVPNSFHTSGRLSFRIWPGSGCAQPKAGGWLPSILTRNAQYRAFEVTLLSWLAPLLDILGSAPRLQGDTLTPLWQLVLKGSTVTTLLPLLGWPHCRSPEFCAGFSLSLPPLCTCSSLTHTLRPFTLHTMFSFFSFLDLPSQLVSRVLCTLVKWINIFLF